MCATEEIINEKKAHDCVVLHKLFLPFLSVLSIFPLSFKILSKKSKLTFGLWKLHLCGVVEKGKLKIGIQKIISIHFQMVISLKI